MIRSRDALIACIERGDTVAHQAVFEGRGFRWAVVATGEPVSRATIARALKAEKIAAIQTDFYGDPCQYGRPE